MLTSSELKAQHCKWDGTHIIVFQIKAQKSDTVSISNLKVTVVDFTGKPYFTTYYPNSKKTITKVEVVQNTPESNIRKEYARTIPYFRFALNNYLLIGAIAELAKDKISVVIEDIDGEKNGGNFETLTFSPDVNFAFPLCSRFSNWERSKTTEFVSNYKPMEIVLKKRTSE